jgi:excisionase family DNA binding protein
MVEHVSQDTADINIPRATKLFCTRKEVAAALTVSIRTVDALIAIKELRAVRIGRSVRVSVEALRAFMRRDHKTCQEPLQ